MRFFLFTLFFWTMNLHADDSPISFSEKHVYPVLEKAIDQKSQFILAGGAFAVFLTNQNDDSTRAQWKNHQKMSKDVAHVGNLLGSGITGALVLGAQYFYDADQNNWMSHGRALVWGTLVTSALKYSFGRPRPGNSDNHHSFPSGHTSTAFATATSLTYAYGWKAAAIAYPVAAFVGLSRLSDDVHWGSDVVGGAFVGFWIARASFYSTSDLVHEKQQQSLVLPLLSPEQQGLTWIYSF